MSKERHGCGYVACRFWVNVFVDNIEAELKFNRDGDEDAMWIETDYSSGTRDAMVTVPSEGSLKEGCRRLFALWLRGAGRYFAPGKLIQSGFLSKAQFKKILKEYHEELQENTRVAKTLEAEIIDVAKELGLHPRPEGTSRTNWVANCPNTHHWIMVAPTSNQFGCGYCRVKGGPPELRAFVDRRRHKQGEDNHG